MLNHCAFLLVSSYAVVTTCCVSQWSTAICKLMHGLQQKWVTCGDGLIMTQHVYLTCIFVQDAPSVPLLLFIGRVQHRRFLPRCGQQQLNQFFCALLHYMKSRRKDKCKLTTVYQLPSFSVSLLYLFLYYEFYVLLQTQAYSEFSSLMSRLLREDSLIFCAVLTCNICLTCSVQQYSTRASPCKQYMVLREAS